jgi:hypothetical protein
MNLDIAIALLDQLHQAQNEFYAGGAGAAAATAPRRETHGRTIMAAE